MSQLSVFDYTTSITIGSIAADMAIAGALNIGIWEFVVAIAIYAIFTILFSELTDRSILLRRWITGSPVVLFSDNTFYYNNMRYAKMDLCEFLTQCRINGYFDLANIHMAILESNGKISFIPVSANRPVLPSDMGLSPTQEDIVANVIMDGKVMKENLQKAGRDRNWLEKELSANGIKEIKKVLLATCDANGVFRVYLKSMSKNKKTVLI